MEQQSQYQHHYSVHGGQMAPMTTHAFSSGRWWSKMSLRVLSIVFNVAIVGFSAYYYTKWTVGALLMLGPPAAVSFLWDWVDAICLYVRRGQYGVHPAACIIVDTLLFFGLAIMSSVIAHTVSKFSDSGWYFALFKDEQGKEYLQIAAGFGFVNAVVHLTILIMAISEIKIRPSSAPRIIYVPVDSNGPVNQQAQVPSWSEQAPPAYSPPTHQQASSSQLQDQIQAIQAANIPAALAEKKV